MLRINKFQTQKHHIFSCGNTILLLITFFTHTQLRCASFGPSKKKLNGIIFSR